MQATLEALRAGRCVVIPTDTVIGLAALPGSPGEEEIFALKQRPATQLLPWLVTSQEQMFEYVTDPHGYATRLAALCWPGPLTLVLPRKAAAGTLAVRQPNHPTALQILEELGQPLACTSANLHGETPATCATELPPQMQTLPGANLLTTTTSQSSTIIDLTTQIPRILREGPIPAQFALQAATFGC